MTLPLVFMPPQQMHQYGYAQQQAYTTAPQFPSGPMTGIVAVKGKKHSKIKEAEKVETVEKTTDKGKLSNEQEKLLDGIESDDSWGFLCLTLDYYAWPLTNLTKLSQTHFSFLYHFIYFLLLTEFVKLE